MKDTVKNKSIFHYLHIRNEQFYLVLSLAANLVFAHAMLPLLHMSDLYRAICHTSCNEWHLIDC